MISIEHSKIVDTLHFTCFPLKIAPLQIQAFQAFENGLAPESEIAK
jgi:hypothetical protein